MNRPKTRSGDKIIRFYFDALGTSSKNLRKEKEEQGSSIRKI
jgi:hypothetical protein